MVIVLWLMVDVHEQIEFIWLVYLNKIQGLKLPIISTFVEIKKKSNT